jgi:hypothetical protein
MLDRTELDYAAMLSAGTRADALSDDREVAYERLLPTDHA